LRGPITVLPIALLIGLVVPVASVLEVIVEPVFLVVVPGTVTGFTWFAKFHVDGVTPTEPDDCV
jgi:hypothetical protein